MSIRTARWALVALCCTSTAVFAQSEDRLDKIDQRLDQLEKKHAEDLRVRDEEIARLREQRGAADQEQADEIDKTTEDVLSDIDAPPEAQAEAPAVPRVPASFVPDIAVILDFVGSVSPDRSNDAYNRLDVREAELDIRAGVHPRADGVLVLAFERDVENPIFAEEEGEEEEGGPETSAGVEEGYLYVYDLGIPKLTAKLGRFHLRFGRQNLLHLHDLPTTDPPFVNQAFLAPEALIDSGVSLSYVIPPDLLGGQYVEFIGEVVSGEGADSESPTFGGDLTVDSPAFNTHLLWNADLASNVNFELGGSWLTGHADADNDRDVNLFGTDVTLLFRDRSGGFRNTVLQAEAFYGIVDQDNGEDEDAFGAYLLAQQQLNRDWYAGVRLDWTENPNAGDQEAWGVTPYLSWYWTEFLRLRASYQHRDGDREEEDVVFFQATWIFGAHPPHPYWSMR